MDDLEFSKLVINKYEAEIERLINAIDQHRSLNKSPDELDIKLYESIEPEYW